ncbi:unnamed protein product [Prorocentrum cordatum]|uniref:Uncharacterized protein n=1 Tax=Prorocentrum cordatum TaxID=2364126 RepID=A0ABN9YC88_9DINO|nr:unnamed protein product [Polarella glacialis]
MVDEWHEQKPEVTEQMKKDSVFPKHPWDLKKGARVSISSPALVEPILEDHAKKQPEDQKVKNAREAAQGPRKDEVAMLKIRIGEFSSRCNKPKEDRTWKFLVFYRFGAIRFHPNCRYVVVVDGPAEVSRDRVGEELPDEGRAIVAGYAEVKTEAWWRRDRWRESEVMLSSVPGPRTEAAFASPGAGKTAAPRRGTRRPWKASQRYVWNFWCYLDGFCIGHEYWCCEASTSVSRPPCRSCTATILSTFKMSRSSSSLHWGLELCTALASALVRGWLGFLWNFGTYARIPRGTSSYRQRQGLELQACFFYEFALFSLRRISGYSIQLPAARPVAGARKV